MAWANEMADDQNSPTSNGRPADVPTLFRLEELVTDAVFAEVGNWWANLPVVGRARGRWVFVEPNGLPLPRQRARREILPTVPKVDTEGLTEKHNASTHFKPLSGEALNGWKSFCLQTTNQAYNHVPAAKLKNEAAIWLRVMKKSHGGLLRPGGLEKIAAWQPGATERQRAALSELLHSLADHMTSRRGRSETKIKFGPKIGERAQVSIIDPFHSELGRPSSAPIAHAVQRKLEQQKRNDLARVMERASSARQRAGTTASKASKADIETLRSKIPIKWPMANPVLESSTQAQMRGVKPKDLAVAIAWGVPAFGACPPATSGMGRVLGRKEWHGEAQHKEMWPVASKTFQPLDEMRRPFDIPGLDRCKSYVI